MVGRGDTVVPPTGRRAIAASPEIGVRCAKWRARTLFRANARRTIAEIHSVNDDTACQLSETASDRHGSDATPIMATITMATSSMVGGGHSRSSRS